MMANTVTSFPRPEGPHDGDGARKDIALDVDRLRADGLFTEQGGNKRLKLELRAMKRRLLRRLKFGRFKTNGEDRQRNLVMTTSTQPAEGKTFTALNLALSLAAEDGVKVLLVDADGPRPRIAHHLGIGQVLGLTDMLAGGQPFDAAKYLVDVQNLPLSVLTVGEERARSSELFSSDRAAAFFNELSARFPHHLIIVDAPPILAAPEAGLLAPFMDEVIFVVEAGRTRNDAIASALDELLDLNKQISMVLNKCTLSDRVVEYGSYEEYYGDKGQLQS